MLCVVLVLEPATFYVCFSGRTPAAAVRGAPLLPGDEGRTTQGWLQSTEPRDSQGQCLMSRSVFDLKVSV